MAMGSPPSCTYLKDIQREASRREPNHMPVPPGLAPFDTKEQRLHCKISLILPLRQETEEILVLFFIEPLNK